EQRSPSKTTASPAVVFFGDVRRMVMGSVCLRPSSAGVYGQQLPTSVAKCAIAVERHRYERLAGPEELPGIAVL
ncbi:MAG: hypothetical protein ACPGXX_03825, partial [Planctomycetaceae bacterium]